MLLKYNHQYKNIHIKNIYCSIIVSAKNWEWTVRSKSRCYSFWRGPSELWIESLIFLCIVYYHRWPRSKSLAALSTNGIQCVVAVWHQHSLNAPLGRKPWMFAKRNIQDLRAPNFPANTLWQQQHCPRTVSFSSLPGEGSRNYQVEVRSPPKVLFGSKLLFPDHFL